MPRSRARSVSGPRTIARRPRERLSGLLVPWIAIATLVLEGCSQVPPPLPGADAVLLITIDTLRADHLGCYGNDILRTPNIDNIAARGLSFDRFYVSCPICMPNRATLMTGRLPSAHGVMTKGSAALIQASPIRELVITDTLQYRFEPLAKEVHTVTTAPLFAKAIRNIHRQTSVSGLFDDF